MIKEILMEGAENAQSGRDICNLLKLTPRELTIVIEQERRAGAPIAATSSSVNPGYFLAADRETMLHYCSRLEHREQEISRTRRACLDTAAALPPKS